MCKQCGQVKDAAEYNITKTYKGKTYRNSVCKACINGHARDIGHRLTKDNQDALIANTDWSAAKVVYENCDIANSMGIQSWYRFWRNGDVDLWLVNERNRRK